MPAFGRKQAPNPKISDMVTPAIDVITQRKTMFAAWIDECAMMQDLIVEGLLANLPSLND